MFFLEGLVGSHRTIQLQLLQHYWLGHRSVRNIKLLETNIGSALPNINHSKILCDSPPRIMEIKIKINKWDLIKLKSLCTAKETKIR